MNKLNYFIFDTHLPAVVIPAPAYARTGYGGNPFFKFRNCFPNQGFSSFTMDSRRSLSSRRRGGGMTEFDDIPYLKLSMFAREMGSGGLARVDSTSWVHR